MIFIYLPLLVRLILSFRELLLLSFTFSPLVDKSFDPLSSNKLGRIKNGFAHIIKVHKILDLLTGLDTQSSYIIKSKDHCPILALVFHPVNH